MRQLPLALGREPRPGFDNFLPGVNAAAVEHLQALTAAAAPVYLWGDSGSGKTHLLRALGAARQAAGQRVSWFDAATALPWALAPGTSLVVFDRCEALEAAAQHAAFAVFVDATTEGVQIAAAGRVPPIDLSVRDDLRTRLAWGHVFALEPLSDELARAALRREADRRGIFLRDEVMHLLLARFPRDLASMMRVLDRIDAFSMAEQRRINVPLLRRMLQEEGDLAAELATP